MTVEAFKSMAGGSKARVICEDCGASEVVPCGYVRCSPNKPKEPNKAQARGKAASLGGAYVKGKLRCKECEEKRTKVVPMKTAKVAVVADVAKAAEVAAPTKRQRIEIFTLLADVYDIDAGRYSKDDTDDSVAEILGVRAGWVAEIREAEFGPCGSNDEIAEAIAALESSREAFTKMLDGVRQAEKAVERLNVEMMAEKERMNSAIARVGAISRALSDRIKAKAGI